MIRKKIGYDLIHLLHAVFILILFISGMILYVPGLRTWFIEYRWEIRSFHTWQGIGYFTFILMACPIVYQYIKERALWQKAFHVLLMITLALAWTVSGLILYINDPSYLGLRQASIQIHDWLSLFIPFWVSGHIWLWYAKKKKLYTPKYLTRARDRGNLLSRREVLILFAGGMVSFVLGGICKWVQPISSDFLSSLNQVKARGYFRIYSIRNDDPVFDPETWRLTVDGLVENKLSFTFEQLMSLPKTKYTHDFHCVTGWSVLGVSWEGVSFQEIAKQARPTTQYVKMYSADEFYTETYELEQLNQQNVILCFNLDGKPLIKSQGAPLRLFHPEMYGYKSIKWLHRIEFVERRDLGYWEEKEGYDLNGYIS